jgi:hypothetical protein
MLKNIKIYVTVWIICGFFVLVKDFRAHTSLMHMLKYHEPPIKYDKAWNIRLTSMDRFIGCMTDRLIVPLTSIRDISKVIEWTSVLIIIYTTRWVSAEFEEGLFFREFHNTALWFSGSVFVQVCITILITIQLLKTTRIWYCCVLYTFSPDYLTDIWMPVDTMKCTCPL